MDVGGKRDGGVMLWCCVMKVNMGMREGERWRGCVIWDAGTMGSGVVTFETVDDAIESCEYVTFSQ